jgi:hypothetical protein
MSLFQPAVLHADYSIVCLRLEQTEAKRVLYVRKSMITLEQLKESSFYQFVEEEGELKNAREMLRLLAAKRFPGIKLGEEVNRIRNLEALKSLCLEVYDLPNAEMLQRRISELAQAELTIAS